MSGMRPVDVAAGIVWRGGRFLAARRPEGKPLAGYWEFPGGKREQGENILQTLRRELSEELGIVCTSCAPWERVTHSYPHMTVNVHFMHVTAFDGEPEPRDGQQLAWVTPEQAHAMSFLPADIGIVQRISPPRGRCTESATPLSPCGEP